MEKRMKPVAANAGDSTVVLLLGLLAALITLVGLSDLHVPVLANLRVDIILLVVVGMAMCAQGGIGRVAATKQWWHPLSIAGYALGGMILLVTVIALAGIQIPFVRNERQALIAIGVMAGLKVLVSAAHSRLPRV
jgi:hypothetical protein